MVKMAEPLAGVALRAATFVAPAVIGYMAFQASSRATAFDMLRGAAACGNPLQTGLPQIFGHCPLCWESAAAAAFFTALAIRVGARMSRSAPASVRAEGVLPGIPGRLRRST